MRHTLTTEGIKLMRVDRLRTSFNESKAKIHQNENSIKRGILICSKDPWVFIGALLAGIISKVPIFLGNPNWRENEWEQVFSEISPALIFGEISNFSGLTRTSPQNLEFLSDFIMIPTGGSGGKVRFAMHTWQGLRQSALATASFLKKENLNSLCLLPLYHISGLMQVIRAVTTDGEILFDPLESFDKQHCFNGFYLSLVPTQLERFMQNLDTINLLKTFDVIFLGGALATNILLKKAREAGIRLAPTYGMTETGSMVTAMHPEDFLGGRTGVGRPLQHAKILINQEGLINIHATSLFNGYFPSRPIKKTVWKANDEGFIDKEDYLSVIGRVDRIIITGGEKVDPQELEDTILATGLASCVLVGAVKDEDWGQRVIAIYVPLQKTTDLSLKIKEQLKKTIANYKIPKDWIMVDQLPFDEKGKITQHSIDVCFKTFRLLLEESQE